MDLTNDHFVSDLLAYLTPLMPYLLKWIKLAGTESAKSLGEELGKKFPDAVKKLWKKIWGKAEKDEELKKLIEAYSNAPDQNETKSALITKLKDQIDEDKKFYNELEQLFLISRLAQPKLNIEIDIDSLAGNAIGLIVTNEDKLSGANLQEINIKEKIKRVTKGGKIIGAQFGAEDDK